MIPSSWPGAGFGREIGLGGKQLRVGRGGRRGGVVRPAGGGGRLRPFLARSVFRALGGPAKGKARGFSG